MKLFLIRHGETDWSLSGQHSGRADLALTPKGEDEAYQLGQRVQEIVFSHVLTSPLRRARQTCKLAGLETTAMVEEDLSEWDSGDYEGQTSQEILANRTGWNIFLDGCPQGEMPTTISARADRLIAKLVTLNGNVALFSHSHFGRVLAARWIGLSIEQGQRLLLNTGSISVLTYEHDRTDQPAIALWNSVALNAFGDSNREIVAAANREIAIQRWENEGGEIVNKPKGRTDRSSKVQARVKRLIVFDLDGTLAESKAAVDAEMVELLNALLRRVKVAVISGGDWPQFQSQLIAHLSADTKLENLSLLPTSGTSFYRYNSAWKRLYADDFGDEEKEKIIRSLKEAVGTKTAEIKETWGEQIEDRGSQITFSALGQQAPLKEKQKWDPDFTKRKKIQAVLANSIPEFTVRLGGTTSLDVTKLGIDKAYGIEKLRELLAIELDEMLFVGDAIFPGGNDYPVKQAGVTSIQVANAEETKRVIETLLASLDGDQPSPLCGKETAR